MVLFLDYNFIQGWKKLPLHIWSNHASQYTKQHCNPCTVKILLRMAHKVAIPYHVKIGPHVIDKSPPIKSAEFDGRAQKYTAFAHGP